MILLLASELNQLFLRIPRHGYVSSVSSWTFVIIHFSVVHETSLRWYLTLSHQPLREVHPPTNVIPGTFKAAFTCGCQSRCCPSIKAVEITHTAFPKRKNPSLPYPMGQKNLNCLLLLDGWVLQKVSFFGLRSPTPLNVQLEMDKANLRYTLTCLPISAFSRRAQTTVISFLLAKKSWGKPHMVLALFCPLP